MARARTDNVIVPDIYQAAAYRRSAEVTDLFNTASGGAIQLIHTPALLAQEGGEYKLPVRFKKIADLDTRVDHTSESDATTVVLQMAQGQSVRQRRKQGPVKIYDDDMLVGAKTPADFSANVGVQFADAQLGAIRDNLVAAGVAAVDSADTTDGSTASADIHILDVARGKTAGSKVTCTHSYLNTLLGKMADAREDIIAFLMPSAVFTDLVGDSIGNYKVDKVAGVTIYQDVVQAFGRIVIVADVPALSTDLTSGYYSEYAVLGLGEGALTATVVYETDTEIDRNILCENPYTLLRRDYEVDVMVQAMKWSPGSATPNPTDAQLATAASWDEDYEDHRHMKIVKGIFNAT